MVEAQKRRTSDLKGVYAQVSEQFDQQQVDGLLKGFEAKQSNAGWRVIKEGAKVAALIAGGAMTAVGVLGIVMANPAGLLTVPGAITTGGAIMGKCHEAEPIESFNQWRQEAQKTAEIRQLRDDHKYQEALRRFGKRERDRQR